MSDIEDVSTEIVDCIFDDVKPDLSQILDIVKFVNNSKFYLALYEAGFTDERWMNYLLNRKYQIGDILVTSQDFDKFTINLYKIGCEDLYHQMCQYLKYIPEFNITVTTPVTPLDLFAYDFDDFISHTKLTDLLIPGYELLASPVEMSCLSSYEQKFVKFRYVIIYANIRNFKDLYELVKDTVYGNLPYIAPNPYPYRLLSCAVPKKLPIDIGILSLCVSQLSINILLLKCLLDKNYRFMIKDLNLNQPAYNNPDEFMKIVIVASTEYEPSDIIALLQVLDWKNMTLSKNFIYGDNLKNLKSKLLYKLFKILKFSTEFHASDYKIYKTLKQHPIPQILLYTIIYLSKN